MKLFKIFILALLALLSTILDTAFFSVLPIYEATIILTFILVMVFALFNFIDDLMVFASFAILFYAVFSSVPIYALLIMFMLLPAGILYLRKNYFPEPTIMTSIFFYIPALLLFELVLVVIAKEWNLRALLSVSYFVIINTVFGMIIYAMGLKIRNYLNVREQIKL